MEDFGFTHVDEKELLHESELEDTIRNLHAKLETMYSRIDLFLTKLDDSPKDIIHWPASQRSGSIKKFRQELKQLLD